MNKILNLLEENARYTAKEIAVMLGISEQEAADEIKRLENDGIVCGYKPIVNRERIETNVVTALIELKVTPKRDLGFDEVAGIISQYPEVQDVYLMSGGFDLALIINGKTFKDIALFVSQRLALLDSVVSTATHFVLTHYKEKGIIMGAEECDERGNASL